MIKRIVIVVAITILLTLGIAVPVFADQPDIPGSMGMNVSESAQDGGAADNVRQMKLDANTKGFDNLGQFIKWGLDEFCGIPPKHTP